jgi:F-type H+-transporting ATPase subunit b
MDSIISTFGNMGVDWRLILMNAVNFGIVAVVIYYFGFRPVLKTMDERKAKIDAGLKYAEEMKKKLDEAELKQAEMIKAARQEAQGIVAKAQVVAKELEDRQMKETSARIEQMLIQGRDTIELERRKMLDELKAEVARLVVLTSTRVLAGELTDANRASINRRAAEELAKTN